jgi:hypothetical protein
MNKDNYLDREKALANAQKKFAKVKWPCMCPKCADKAINSHLLQRHGILSHVTVDNHLYEITREDAFKWHDNYPVRFKKVGLNNAISYPLFCDKHDTEFFLPIESGPIDFDDYRSQLLFSYRAVCAEIRKKEVNILETKENMANIEEMSLAGEAILEGGDKGIKDLKYYKYLLEDELKSNKGKFTFFHYSYPVLDIYSSATMSYEIFDSKSDRQVEEAIKKKVWDSIFIHIIPQPVSTEIIVGYHNNHTSRDLEEYVKSWKGLCKEEMGYKLTDLFVAHVEDWGLSPRLYERIPEERFEKFFELQAKYSTVVAEQKTNVGYNLFEGLL